MLTGIVLMTYGSPSDLDDVGPYMTRVRGGRAPDADLLIEFRRRYAAIGMSPLVQITTEQARGLAVLLGSEFVVTVGMRFSEPRIEDAVRALITRGAERVLGLILSPQYSPSLMGGYDQALQAAADGIPARTVGAWHLQPAFVEVIASRVRRALGRYPADERGRLPVLLTAHSLPRRVVEREPDYVNQLAETASAVATAAGLAPDQALFVYQSAGHTPEEWLKPDMLDVLPQLAAAGHADVIVAPVQFLADHLETLYDVDIAGWEQASAAGISRFARIEAPNAAPDFIAALRDVVQADLAVWNVPVRGTAWARA